MPIRRLGVPDVLARRGSAAVSRTRRRTLVVLLAGTIAIVGLHAATSTPAVAGQPVPGHNGLVPITPRTDLPRITNGEVADLDVIGNRVFVAGSFTSIANAGEPAIAQKGLASYNIDTGKVDEGFRPVFDGDVLAVEASPDGSSLYVAGSFNTVGGITKRKIVRLDPATGAPIAAFTANASAQATAIAVSATAVYVGGQFKTVNGVARESLVALNPATGAVDTGFTLPISGGIGLNGMLTVQQLKLTHDDSTLMVVHTGRQIGGQDRYGVGMIDTATKALLPWRTRLWQDNIAFVGGVQRVVAGDIAPDDSYFVVTSGSGGDGPPINDTTMAFPLAGQDNVQPRWISRNFDSVYSVAVTERAVYIGGHFSWNESPTSNVPWPGLDTVSYGTGNGLGAYALGDQVVRRDHLGALDPATGTALEWNPGSNSFLGEKAMKATSRGLFVGGDGSIKGGKTTGRVAFFDLAQSPADSPVGTTIDTPIEGSVKASGTPFSLTGHATAPAGVSKVQVEVTNRANGQYLQDDLTSWGAANSILANLGTAGATAATWSLSLSLPVAEYQVQAKAFAADGASDPSKAVKKIETFSVEDQTPLTTISAPAAGLLATTAFTVTGTATDDKGVTAMSYWFRNKDNLYLQDDGSVSPTYHTFKGEPDVVGATSTTWQYEVELPSEGDWKMSATAIDTARQSDIGGATRSWTVSASGVPPTVTITAPAVANPPGPTPKLTVAPGSPITFSGTAADEDRLSAVEVYLRNTSTHESLAADGTWGADSVTSFHRITPVNFSDPSYNWTFTSVPLSPGVYDFRVRALDNLGLQTPPLNVARLNLTVQVPGDAFPNGLLSVTGVRQDIDKLHLDLSGTAKDDNGVQAVRVSLRDLDTGRYVQPDGTMSSPFATVNAALASSGAKNTTFTLPIDLPTKGEFAVEAWAVDTAGQPDSNTTGATTTYLVYPGDLDPWLAEGGTPGDDTVYTDSKISVSGRAFDDVGMGRVELQISNSAGQGMSTTGIFSTPATAGDYPWIGAFLTSPGTPGSNYVYASPVVPPGTYQVVVRGVDNYDKVQQAPRTSTVTVR
ncbi:MAG: hypothetical protein JWO79_91 [Actinomycetia bacterium]|nr:hypothetical protein [Actinomycetes bacterium]